MKANDFVKLVFGYFADNPEAGLDFIERVKDKGVSSDCTIEDLSPGLTDVIRKYGIVGSDIVEAPPKPTAHPAVDAEQPKKKRGRQRAVKKQDVDKTKSNPDSLDERMESAYMGEHVNIEPEQPEKKPLSPKERVFYDYILAHPDAKMPRVCADLHLSMAMYYYLKRQIKIKGYNIQGAVDFNVVEEKPEPGIL